MPTWPLFRESLLQGPSHVSLALPGKPSMISKSVGGVDPALLLIPNLEFLNAFIDGNVGIADNVVKGMVAGIINSPQISTNEDVVKSVAKSLKLDLPDVSKFKDAQGKINIPITEIKVPDKFKNVGMQGVEKTIMKSIFETQKPFIEVTKSILGSMVKIEDVVARVMPLLATNPLTSKSEKPIVKDGSRNGSKAVGYQNGIDFKKVLAELEKLSKKGSDITIDKDGNPTITKKNKKALSDQPLPNDQEALLQNKLWETVSVVYSTGEFDPTVNYIYSYVLLPSDEEGPNNLTPDPEDNLPENPYDKYKPKRLIFGMFKSDGTPLNPKHKLKTVSLNGILASKVDTPFNTADWVYKSPKWKFRGEDYVWPSMGAGSGEPIYLWEGPFFTTRESKTSPGDKWSIKKYKEGDKNRINTDVDAIPDDPIIVKFDSSDTGEYNKYFGDFLTSRAKMFPKVDAAEKKEAITDIMGRMDTQSHLQNVFLYGSGPSSFYRQYVPPLMKKSFKPYQIYASEAVSDPYLDGTGMIWIDPEADYEFKVIRVDPSTKVAYKDAKGEPVLSSQIKAFVKNKVIFTLKNGKKFDIEIKKNGSVEDTATDVTEYTLENWNYENGKVNSLNFYNVRIKLDGEEVFDELYTGFSLPDFGISKKITVDSDSLLDSSDEEDSQMPIYNIKVTDSNAQNGVLINPDAISNDYLATDKLFSDGIYGNGTKENPQDIEVIKRFARTDLDTESYYIIEGVLVEDNKKAGGQTNSDASGDDGSRWYRLPHAIGAIIPFLSMLFDLAMKMFPNISKLLKLFKDPTKFITDIITEKLGESFDIFGEPAFDKFKSMKDIISKKKDIVAQGNTSDYVGQIQTNFNTSPLKNHVAVDKLSFEKPGKFNFLLDGVAMIPFEIFGKSIPFGLELKMSNLVPEVPNINVPKVPQVDVPKIPDPNVSLPSASVGAGGVSATVPTAPTVPNVQVPKVAVPNVGIPSVTLPKVQSPIKLIKGKIGKAKFKDCAEEVAPKDTKGGQSNSDYLNALNNAATDNTDKNANKKTVAPGTLEITSTWYSTGQFINGVDYNYYYVTEDQREVLKEVDELMYPGSTNLLNSPNSDPASDGTSTATPDEDLQLAKEKLEAELSKDPQNELLNAKLKELKDKLLKSAAATQPILKIVLGIVSGPIKVVACIVQWLFDFFKSILNPMMLPAKIIELLSFKWIMKFFSPAGLMQTFGINYNPAIPEIWKGLIGIPTPKIPDLPKKPEIPDIKTPMPKMPDLPQGNLPQGNLPKTPEIPKMDMKGGFPVNKQDLLKNLNFSSLGDWIVPGNLQIGDMTQFLDVAFMAKLPTYSAENLRLSYNLDNLFATMPKMPNLNVPSAKMPKPDIPKLQKRPILCLIEKLINAFIDFIWSLLGIEVIIPPPHIKLCDQKTPSEVDKLKNGDTSVDDTNATEIVSTKPYVEKPVSDHFVYEVAFEDGTTQTFKDYDALQEFIDSKKDTSFDMDF